jgi:hypothetical protein
MANTKISQLSTATQADYTDDAQFPLNAVDATTGEITTKKATLGELRSNYFCSVKCASITITAAQVLNLNSATQTILAAQGVGVYISPILVDVTFTNGTTQYDTNVDAEVKIFGADVPIFTSDAILNADQDCTRRMIPYTTSFVDSDKQLISNSNIYFWSPTGAPANGDYDLEVSMLYYEYSL